MKLAISLSTLRPYAQRMPLSLVVLLAWVAEHHRRGEVALLSDVSGEMGINRETLTALALEAISKGFAIGARDWRGLSALQAQPKLLRMFNRPAA